MARKEVAVKKYVVKLSDEEREQLNSMINKGKHPARYLLKARILLKADTSDAGEGWSDSQIATALVTSVDTVARIRQRLVEEGVDGALKRHHSPASARQRVFDGEAEAKLTRFILACGPKAADSRGSFRRRRLRLTWCCRTSTPTAIAYASGASGVVRSAAAGSKVTAVATTTAPGGHALNFQWVQDPPQSGFVSANTSTLAWQVPSGGLANLYVLASDGFGGYAMSWIAMSTTPNRIVFSGTVHSVGGAAIDAARVTINGVRARQGSTARSERLDGLIV